ncbi:MAG TPA: cytochrome c oxidase assembly protein [Solirubrobacteraceae bacterium]|nr:cytochrome c oxidase assembly protein [Solirubrobacteraceae bacterium]
MSALSPAAVGPVEGVLLPLLALAWWIPYRARVRALDGTPRAVPGWRQACYAGGLVVLAVALSPPVDRLADQLLVAHMVEHLLIGDIAALLIVLGLTGPLLAPVLRNRVIARLRVLTHPIVAVAAWGTNFYVWHSPVLYQAALRHDPIHALQHATFLGFGICVWMALLGPLPKPAWFTNSARLVYIIVVRLIGTVLANAMIFSGTVWYPYYSGGDARWHIGRMADQISAGGAMMVEESILTICLFAWLFLKVAREGEERQQLLDFAAAQGVELDPQRAARAVAAGRADELWERVRARGSSPREPSPPPGPAAPIS